MWGDGAGGGGRVRAQASYVQPIASNVNRTKPFRKPTKPNKPKLLLWNRMKPLRESSKDLSNYGACLGHPLLRSSGFLIFPVLLCSGQCLWFVCIFIFSMVLIITSNCDVHIYIYKVPVACSS